MTHNFFSIPFDSTPDVFDSEVPLICHNEWNIHNFLTSQHLHRCTAQRHPFPCGSVCVILIPGWNSTYHGHDRTTIEPGVVGTAIQGTLRLQSDFEVRYSRLFSSYFYHSIFDSWPATIAQHASGNPSQVSHHFFLYTLEIYWTDGFPADPNLMKAKFADAFFRMGLLGQVDNKDVGNRR